MTLTWYEYLLFFLGAFLAAVTLLVWIGYGLVCFAVQKIT